MTGGGLQLAVVFLLAAVIAVPVFRRFGLGAVLGYLAAGVVLGPFGLRVIRNAEPVLAASEIGVVMMLFVIGLELSPARLKVMRRPAFGGGGAAATAGATGNAPAWFDGNEHQAVFTGFKSQALSDSQTGSGGYQQLRLDDPPRRGRGACTGRHHPAGHRTDAGPPQRRTGQRPRQPARFRRGTVDPS